MSWSRRRFTKEFKEAAVRRLELGASVAEVARARGESKCVTPLA
jgi:transposase-like protein